MHLATNNIRNMFKSQLAYLGKDAPMLEIIGAAFVANEDTIFGTVNEAYVEREIAWYKSMSLNVQDLMHTPKIWKQIATVDGYINSNYGWCIYSPKNDYQYMSVLKELQANPESRRGTMIYNRPNMHDDAIRDGMNDFICTNAVNYFIRDNKLHCVVQMRSNDAVFGYKNDYYWQQYVLNELAEDLHIEVGNMHWQVGTLHVYPRHYYLVEGDDNGSN